MKTSRFVALSTLALLAGSACQPGADESTSRSARELAKQRFDASELMLVAEGEARFEYLGRSASTYKFSDEKGNLYGIALDESRKEVDIDELRARNEQARAERNGSFDDSVLAMLANGAERLTVSIWVATTGLEPAPRPEPRERALSPEAIDAIYAKTDATRARALERFIAPALSVVKKLDPEARSLAQSPIIYATLSAKALRALEREPSIDRIYFEGPAEPELDVAKLTTGVPAVNSAGFTGKGVRVAITEAGGAQAERNSLFLSSFVQDFAGSCGPISEHATAVAGIFKERRLDWFGTSFAENGITPDAELRVGGSCGSDTTQLHAASTRAADWGARAINLSWGLDTALQLRASDRFYDDIVLHRFRTIVKSAGNRAANPNCFPNDGVTTSPGLAYNVITVGGLNDANTVTWSDDTMFECSSSSNPSSTHSDREKPELVAPAVDLTLVGNGPASLPSFTGTSGAAPQVAAASALFMQKNGMLAIWPEITRAIVMATARNVEGASRLSSLDGAGALVTSAGAELVGDTSRWGGMSYGCNVAQSIDLMTLTASPRTRHRVVLSWDSDPAFGNYASEPSVDIDLAVVDSLGRTIASSASWDGTNEIAEFDSWNAGTYRLQAKKFRCNTSTWLGWAWSVGSMTPKGP